MLKHLIILLLLFLPVAGGAYAAQSYYVVTANTLNVRSGPGTYYSVAYKLHRGDTVVATGVSGQWTVIQHNGLRYYASNRYLRYVGRCMRAFEALMGEENMRAVLGMDSNGEGVKAVSVASKQLMADFERGLISPEEFITQILPFCRPGTTRQQIVDAWMAMLDELPKQ